ncbi:MAG: hypothetical protein LBT78_04850, partial [Tannerella sp.]|nr:hypothetical protein [Tannerella sp.]
PSKVLFFGAQGIKFDYGGDVIGEATLLLLGDFAIPIHGGQAALVLRGGFNNETGTGVEMTYMKIDCNGFKELAVTADIIFPESLIRKVDDKDVPVAGVKGRVSASFHTVVSDWTDILASITLPRFEVVGLDGFIFNIKNAVFDYSDKHNGDGVVFPNNYSSKYLIPGNAALWKGVFISRFDVALPKQFANRDSSNRISFAATNMLLDNNGISGIFEGNNVLNINKGSAGGWRFSVDKFALELEANQLVAAGFSGNIGLPISDTSNLAYTAFISPANEYLLKVEPAKDLNFDVWAAKAEILANSYVELKIIDGQFRPEALLNGSLSIGAKKEGSAKNVAELKGIKFTALHLQTVSPYISVNNLGYDGEMKLKNFPLSVSQIALTANNNEVKLGFNAKLSLVGDKVPITADTRLEIVSAMGENKGMQSWQYKKINVSEIGLDVSMAEAFRLTGRLNILDDDPVYGDGFSGEVNLKLEKGMNIEVGVRAIFGVKDFRYWFVDGLAKFPGILVAPPAIKLNGFGGGAYYKMRPEGAGSMPTGTKYVPDDNYSLGIKAAVMFNIGSESLIQGETSFEIAFNKNGGLNFIGFYGQAKFLGEIPGVKNIDKFVGDKFKGIAKLEEKFTKNNPDLMKTLEKLKVSKPNDAGAQIFEASEKAGEAGLLAALGIQFDFTNKSLHATFDVYANVAGGMLRGVNAGNKAGKTVFHVEPGKWYIHVGTPTNPVGLEFNLANLVKMQTKSYFMAGHDIPGSPPPPQQVADILGVELSKLDYMRDLNSLGDGKGLAFGSSLSISTGDITFLILYASLKAGLGFDIMLKDYGDASCAGRSGPIGIDGWYANGQAYAYLQGEIGVNVNLLFVKKKIPVIKSGAAALLQAKLPNPSWFAGQLGVRFDLLGGLVKGNMQLKITLGEECQIVMPGGVPLGLGEMIADITPQDNSNDVDVFAAPQVAFNMVIDKSFELLDDNGAKKKYRIKMDEFTVKDNNVPIEGKQTWNSDKNAISFFSHEILPPKAKLKAFVKVHLEENNNGTWTVVTDGKTNAEETKEISFTTGEAPTSIPLHNIEYCYPVIDQQYFHTKETTKAYVQLKRGQEYLFASNLRHEVQIIKSKEVYKQSLNYNADKKCVEYTIPEIKAKTVYTFNIMSFGEANETQVTEEKRVSVLSDDNNDVTKREAQAAEVTSENGTNLLTYEFKTSSYGTFKEKI